MVRNDLSYDANSGQLILVLTISADPLQLFVQHFGENLCWCRSMPEATWPKMTRANNFAFLHEHRRCTSPNHLFVVSLWHT